MAKRVLIGGGTGFIGQALSSHLTNHGYHVSFVSRHGGPNSITWDQVKSQGIPRGIDAVIQVSGANILMKPWTESRKQELLDSRVQTTEMLVEGIKKSPDPPSVFISGSAVGIYPTQTDEVFTEDSDHFANNFAGNLVQEWEKASMPLASTKTRRVVTRFGVVLGDGGGMLKSMSIPFRLGMGGKIGSGQQWMPWVHVKDVARLHQHIIENSDVHGVLNAVAPEMITNYQLTKTLGKVMSVPTILPVPAIAIRLLFGQRAFLLLEGQKVVPKKTLDTNFKFHFPDLETALRDVITNK